MPCGPVVPLAQSLQLLLRRVGFAAGQVQSTMGTVPLAEVREAGRAGPLMLFQARPLKTLAACAADGPRFLVPVRGVQTGMHADVRACGVWPVQLYVFKDREFTRQLVQSALLAPPQHGFPLHHDAQLFLQTTACSHLGQQQQA